MSDLFWPGDSRAGTLLTSASLLEAMTRVEAAWLAALVAEGVAPEVAADDLTGLVGDGDLAQLAGEAESGGNPAIPLVALLRERVAPRNRAAATWLHRGLTSQDTVDTALACCLVPVLDTVSGELRSHVEALLTLLEAHGNRPMTGRTLTQPAVPILFGTKIAGWLDGVLGAADLLAAARPGPAVQLGGAAGTMAAAAELAALRDLPDPAHVVARLIRDTAGQLGLAPATAWHTTRVRLTRYADALLTCTDAWGHVANDVLTLSRPEIGELAEGHGGGSSTMPHKANPVLSVLIRRAALAAPSLAAQLHLAAAEMVEERAGGAWHLEWAALRDLGRRTVVAARQATELLRGLRVHHDRMRTNLEAALPGVLAERRTMAGLLDQAADEDPATYLGNSATVVEQARDRARQFLSRPRPSRTPEDQEESG